MNADRLCELECLMGDLNEQQYTPIIKSKIDNTIKTATTKWSSTDYKTWISNIELKSRTCKSTEFKDTMFGSNKLKYAWNGIEKFGKRVYFCFAFTDGLFKWELTRENYELAGGDKAIYMSGTNERGVDDYKMHFHIPVEQLVKIDDTPCIIPEELLKYKTERKIQKNQVLPVGICLIKLPKKIIL
jgi:hypothetical protein